MAWYIYREMENMEKNLLIVDDEASVLKSLYHVLKSTGLTIHMAESGQAGLNLLAAQSIDLVLADFQMPEMDGGEFLRQVKETTPDAVRIIVTGNADYMQCLELIKEGVVNMYVTKPWENDSLRAMVTKAAKID